MGADAWVACALIATAALICLCTHRAERRRLAAIAAQDAAWELHVCESLATAWGIPAIEAVDVCMWELELEETS